MKALLRTQPPPQPHSFLPAHRAVLQRKCACGGTLGPTGDCPECAKKKKRSLQRKLLIGASNDPLEDEADRVADQVLAGPARPAVTGTPLRIQRFTGQPAGQMDAAPASVDQVLSSPGRPLEPQLRSDMESRFGHDFSRVRLHSSAAAEDSAREVNAQAYTAGHNIVFGSGRFAPETRKGRRLLAHELTHVVQQHGGGSRANSLQRAPAETASSSDEETAAPEEAPPDTTAAACGPGGGGMAAGDDESCSGSADLYAGTQVFEGKFPPALTGAFGTVFNPLQSWLDGKERDLGKHFPILNGNPLLAAPVDVAKQILGPEKKSRPGVKIQTEGRRRLAFFDPASTPPNLAESWIILPKLQSTANSNWELPNADASKVANWVASAGADRIPIEFRGSDGDCYNRSDPVRFVVSFSESPSQMIEEHEQRHAEDWRKTFCRIIGGRDRKITKRTGAANSRAGWALNDPAKAEGRALQSLYRGIDSKLETAENLLAGQDQARKRLHGISRLNFQLNRIIVKEQCEVVLVDAGIKPRGG
ncbi:MAG: DUF4157 domain-containing protein [Chthoniobacterales bacterium]